MKVPVPPLSAARVDGVYNVKVKTTSQSGYVDDLGSFTLGWSFIPKCDAGACDVVWSDLSYKQPRKTLNRKKANYSGTDTGEFLGGCEGVRGSTTVDVSFRVTKARVLGGEWKATRLVGTLSETHPSQFGCVSGSATFNITASLS